MVKLEAQKSWWQGLRQLATSLLKPGYVGFPSDAVNTTGYYMTVLGLYRAEEIGGEN